MQIVDYKKRNSRLAKRICNWFKIHRDEDLRLGEILDKYCEVGMSQDFVVNLLTDMTDGQIVIKTTPLWEAWKAEVVQGRCGFRFHSKFPGNKYHGNLGKSKRKKKSIVMENALIDVQYTCLDCGKKSKGRSQISKDTKLISLKAFLCPNCGEYDTTTATFILEDKTVYKAMVNGTETFVTKENVTINRKETINA